MKPIGLLLTAVLVLLPLVWLPGIAQGPGKDLIALFSQYLGMVGLIAMALAQLIATRWPGVEACFGPLDQSYKLHKWLGITGLVTVLVHDTIDAEMDGLGAETALVEVAETAGEISLYALLILVVITIATFIPYTLWKLTHRFIGLCFVLGAVHYLFILKPFGNGDPLGLYMAAICGLGVVAYIYTSMPRTFRPAQAYTIDHVSDAGTAKAIVMTPNGKGLHHSAGQFGFFSFGGAGLPEPHPFTISSAPAPDRSLRITVAPLGDLTRRVGAALQPGQSVRVEGPFGHFGRGVTGPQVWIAAGVGVTPFLALANALPADNGPVRFIYAVRNRADAAHLVELEDLASRKANLDLTVWQSTASGRLTIDAIEDVVGREMLMTHVLFCGPVEMRRALAIGLSKLGLPQKRFHYEEFEIRTGLGLRRLFAAMRRR